MTITFYLTGISYLFGKRVVDEECKRLNISLIIRSHMVVPDGFEVMTGRLLIEVFSVANYAGTANNAAAVLCVNEKLKVTYQKLTAPHPLFQVSTLPLTANLDSTIALSDLKQVKRFVKF
ncbi:Protein CBG11669 [Caenorhabditis briggsae]|uniref:Protein CBG11669 n=1 Tax=Caenorhabditis briggsae TaxID=6238 RepID=A8XDR8_CAEBR|nr:Protein CBG11669 [Caenorhabditis briggsae]CAP30788.1 Protein CBG11669 [Caenorhabditis briggsae]